MNDLQWQRAGHDHGEALARELGWRFLDADDFHPPENVAKMKAGVPLTDADRWPWLARLNRLLKDEQNAVLACSALKQSYRERLAQGIADFSIVYLHGSFELISRRMAERRHRYMPASLLQSQFTTLEAPGDAVAVEVSGSAQDAVAAALARLER